MSKNIQNKKCDECKNFKTIKIWTEKFEDKHGVLAGYLGVLITCSLKECIDCGNQKLEKEKDNI